MSTEDRKEPVAESFFIAPLEQLVRDDLALAGGKGANLGALVNAGFPVPQGFAVTTDAYDLLLKESGLGRTIAAALEEGPTAGATIREAFLATGVPPEIDQEIVEAYRDLLGAGAVAVRSSATAEDLLEAAFAGAAGWSCLPNGAAHFPRRVRSPGGGGYIANFAVDLEGCTGGCARHPQRARRGPASGRRRAARVGSRSRGAAFPSPPANSAHTVRLPQAPGGGALVPLDS